VFDRNVGINLHVYAALQPRRPASTILITVRNNKKREVESNLRMRACHLKCRFLYVACALGYVSQVRPIITKTLLICVHVGMWVTAEFGGFDFVRICVACVQSLLFPEMEFIWPV
jgi:hypothetical protein